MTGTRPDDRSLPSEPDLGDVEGVLRALIADLEPVSTSRRGVGRPAVLPAMCLWGGMVVCVLRGCSSQLALWRLITQLGLWDYPRYALSDQAIYHRLARDGTTGLVTLYTQVSALLGERLAPHLPHLGPALAPFATDIIAIDETTLDPVARRLPVRGDPATRCPDATADAVGTTDSDMPRDTAAAPPDEASSRASSGRRRLPGKVALVFDVRRQCCRRFEVITDPHQHETVLATTLLDGLARGTLILADLGYFRFPWFDELTDRGFWWISRMRTHTSYRVEHTFLQHGDTFDGLVWLGAYRADRAAHLVRLVQYRRGSQLHRYITNVRDPDMLSMADIVTLYARRWDIEMAIALIKQHLGLSLWWSTKDTVIHQQLIATMLIAQILQALRLEIAVRAEVDIFDVSMPLLVRYLPLFAAQGEDPVAAIVERGHDAGFIRPSRRIRYTTPDPPLAPSEPIAIRTVIPIMRTPRYASQVAA